MSASNKKSWVLVAIGGAAALAAIVYGVRWIGHKQTRKVVTAQVDEWERLWLPVRSCLVGDETTFASAGHAYLVYEATHVNGPDREAACEPLIRKLKRPGAESTGVAAVEKSWDNIREAGKQLSNAFVGVIDRSTYSPMGPRRARLAAALDGMDAAHARLREDSDMEPLPARAPQPSPAALPEGLSVAGVDFLVHGLEVVAGALVLEGDAGEQRIRAIVRGPDKVSRQVYPPRFNQTVAADDARWMAWSDTDEQNRRRLLVADLDQGGAPGQTDTVVYTAPDESTELHMRVALGQGDLRVVFFDLEVFRRGEYDSAASGLHVVRSTDRGATFGAPVRVASASRLVRADSASRQFDIIARDLDGGIRWFPVQAASLDAMAKPRRLYQSDMLEHSHGCTRGTTGWWLHEMSELYYVADEGGARPIALPDTLPAQGVSLVDCTDKQAVLAAFTDSGLTLHACDARSCGAPLAVPQASQSRYVVGMSQDAGAVGVTQTDQLILMWRGSDPVRAYLGTPGHEIRALVEWDGVMHLVTTSEEGSDLRVVPLS